MVDLNSAMLDAAEQTDRTLERLLPRVDGPEARLLEAMRYATFAGGKRLRPLLALESGRLFDMDDHVMLRICAAIECVHTYSLIHDDLPSMDDDDERRGKSSTHIHFDEATAILAGDALQSLAFEILSHEDTHTDPHVRCALISHLAQAIGPRGMVGGQMIDLSSGTSVLDIGTITRLQRMKTGALIAFSCEAGALAARARRPAFQALNAYAHDLGLAFQIADDLLDVEGDPGKMGKAARKDGAKGKATFVAVLGVDRARDQAKRLADQAIAHLDFFDKKADCLRAVAEFMVSREN